MTETSQSAGDDGALQRPHRTRDRRDLTLSTVLELDDKLYDDDGLDLRSIIQPVLAHWPWVIAAGALGLAISLSWSLTMEPLYRASATIELNPPTVSVLGGSRGDEEVTGYRGSDRRFEETQLGLLKSRGLARKVVERLGLAGQASDSNSNQSLNDRIDDIAENLAGGLAVSPVGNSQLVNISYSSDSPQEAARIVNGFASAYIQESIDRKFDATAKTREFLANQIKTTRQRLSESEKQLVDYARANNIVLPGGGEDGKGATSLTSSSLASLNEALAEAQQKRIAAEGRYKQAGSLTENQSATASLRSERAALQAELDEKSTFLGEDYPEMIRLRARIDALNREIRNASGSASSGIEAEYRAALAEENALRARVRQLSGNVLDEQSLSIEYKALQREVDTQRSLYQALLQRSNQIGVVEGVGAPAGAVVDEARVPAVPYSPNIPRNLILGLLLGLGFGAMGAFTYESLTDLIKTPDDVRDKLNQPVLGAIPRIKRDEDLTEEFMDPISPISESYGSLMTTLMFSTNKGMPKVLCVTSASAAEGKSTTSLALARRLANSGAKVVLIDADMRRPSFVFDSRPEAGLSQLLTSQGAPDAHLIKTEAKGLHILPSGPIPPNPSMLLNSNDMRVLVSHLSSKADHVIIDCPPALGFADSALIGSMCDGTLMVVESGKTRRRAAIEAIIQLRNAQNHVLGVVLTKCASSQSYGYYYGYYDKDAIEKGRSKPHELTPQIFGGGETE